MNLTILCYSIYLPVTIIITVWVATTLFKNGHVFLHDIFHGNDLMAASVNRLLLVGFYLINIGYAVLVLSITQQVDNYQSVFEVLSQKLGFIILVLGGMHFFNMYLFFRGRKKSKENTIRYAQHQRDLDQPANPA